MGYTKSGAGGNHRLPKVGREAHGEVLAVHPPDTYVFVSDSYGGQPAVVKLDPLGIPVARGLKPGTYVTPAGNIFWLRRSARGRFYAQILVGERWVYVGIKPFPGVASWELLRDGEPWCGYRTRGHKRCKGPLVTVGDLRLGLCNLCAWAAEHGEPTHADMRGVTCQTCWSEPGEACRDDDDEPFDGHHRARRDAYVAGRLAGQVGVPA
jgi:hypothetical protein